jgi:hypothetical protein
VAHISVGHRNEITAFRKNLQDVLFGMLLFDNLPKA